VLVCGLGRLRDRSVVCTILTPVFQLHSLKQVGPQKWLCTKCTPHTIRVTTVPYFVQL
jgi:hypothetical protein